MNFFDFGELINEKTQFVIFGIPWDYLSSNELPNSSTAPETIRNITNDIGYTTELGFNIPNFKAVDAGDIKIEPMEVNKNLETISNFIKELFNQNENITPIMIGGDHFCTYPVVKVVAEHITKKEEFGVLIFDSHLDFYQEWDKGIYSHATISHRIFDLNIINNKNLLIVGARDIDIDELNLSSSENLNFINAHHIIDGLDNYIKMIKEFFQKSNIKKLYISIDIDALDPSVAPGTGYAIPGGFSYRDMWKILKEITTNFNVVGFDLVEVAPNLDLENKMTSILASKLIIEFMDFIRRSNV
jgi:agmatinase